MSVSLSAGQWYEKGDAALRAGQYDEADEAFRDALVIEPRHTNALYRLGELALFRGEVDIAEDLFRQTLAVDPAHAWARKKLDRMSQRKSAPSPSAKTKPAKAAATLPTYDPVGPGIVGTVQSVRRFSENYQLKQGTRPVWAIRVRKQRPGDLPGNPIAAEMRGNQIRGELNTGDWVQFPAGWVPGKKLVVLRNLTTGGEVRVARRWLASAFTVLVVGFVSVWIVVLFFIVGRQLFFG
jgi:hypothetical protein